MARDTSSSALGTDTIRWDLTQLYKSVDDPQIDADVVAVVERIKAFEEGFKGQLSTRLGDGLEEYARMHEDMTRLQGYANLEVYRATGDAKFQKLKSRLDEIIGTALANHAVFFELEAGRLSENEVQAQVGHPVVAKHLPLLRQLRAKAKHMLAEEVEAALARHQPFGQSSWANMMDELEAVLEFTYKGETLGLAETLTKASYSADRVERAELIKIVNDGLKTQKHADMYARALNVIAGDNLASDAERGYSHPMEATNLGNMVDDATVEILHDVARTTGAELAQRFYRFKARLLGLDVLAWSDRNAPLPFESKRIWTWAEGCTIVREAYHDFSPTLATYVERGLAEAKVDAPPAKGKVGGAFNATMALPYGPDNYMLMNYHGMANCVVTVAHEMGHCVHGLLALEEQGPLMWSAPLPYAETASICGEFLVFEKLMKETDEPRERLAMYVQKINDFCNSAVRQMQFSEFERGFYARRREGKLSTEDFNTLWLDTIKQFYGKDGEVFTYEDAEHLWSYISHFAAGSPFYVYSYAFGELFTHSLMAQRGRLGERFEPLYLDLLRAGGTKSAVELMEPFGLNPNSRDFWEAGIASSAGMWLTEAEKLADALGL